MRLHWIIVGAVSCLSAALTAQGATDTCLDWRFESSANPALPTPATTANPFGGAATASILQGANTYFFGVGPGGTFGTPPGLGLWDMEKDGLANALLKLELNLTPVTTVNLGVEVTQFIDASPTFYPGTIDFSLPNAVFDGRTTVVPQTGIMTGYWVTDTYHWDNVSFPAAPITLDIRPGTGTGALLLDEVKFNVTGELTAVPEPSVVQIATIGLLALGSRLRWRRKA